MDCNNKEKSTSLESPTQEESSLLDSVADIRLLKDDEYRALLEKASKASYTKNTTSDNLDTGQLQTMVDNNLCSPTGDALSSTGLSKDAQKIYAVLKDEADRDTFREDEAVDVRFDQKKLGKSASHESCQSKPTRLSYGRYSSFNSSRSMDVDTVFNSCLFGTKPDDGGYCSIHTRGGLRCRNSGTGGITNSANCGCRSPGATVAGQQQQRLLNRSYSSTGTRDDGCLCDCVTGVEEDRQRLHSAWAESLNCWRDSDDEDRHVSRGELLYRTKDEKSSGANDRGVNENSVELGAMQPLEALFRSSSAVVTHTDGGKKRSSSQRGHNRRRQVTDDYGRMTRSELGSFSGTRSSPPRTSRLQRRKRTQQEERGVMLSEQMNGFRGDENLDDLLVYIEGPDARKKTQTDQQNKKAKKKTGSDSGGGAGVNSIGNTGSGGGVAKKEKVRRSTEGDYGRSGAGGGLNYKHRSTDSLGPSCPDDDRRPLAATGKSTSSDGTFGVGVVSRDDSAVPDYKSGGGCTHSALVSPVEKEETKGTVENVFDDSGNSWMTAAATDDEQFIPVTNKKQKRSKMEQLRRPGRPMKYKDDGTGMDGTKRSVTPPARERATFGGRRRRNSFDYSGVSGNDGAQQCIDPALTGKVEYTDFPQMGFDDSKDTKPSYANVLRRRTHSPPVLGDFINRAATVLSTTTSTSKQKFNKRRNTNYAVSSRTDGISKDGDGVSRNIKQTQRQSTSLNASRSSSPVGIPTAVATNLANASSPDLKSFMGESLASSLVGGHIPKVTYAAIAMGKPGGSLSISQPSSTVGPQQPLECHEMSEETDSPIEVNSNGKKSLTDTAVNTEPAGVVDIPAANLGEKAFIFEQNPSTSEICRVIRKTGGDRSSCSGKFVSPEIVDGVYSVEMNQTDLKPNSNSGNGSGNGNRERRNSCPVQFLDKAAVGHSLDKPLVASGLNFVYGDAEDDEEICAALARLGSINSPMSPQMEIVNMEQQNEVTMVAIEPVVEKQTKPSKNMEKSIPARPVDMIPEKALRAMANYVSREWMDFTRDPSSMVYYDSINGQ